MSPMLATLAMAAAAGIGFAAATSLSLAVSWSGLQRRFAHRHPEARARVALQAAIAPVVVPIALVALCLAPGLLGWLGLHADHCVQHPAHPHLCLVHPAAMLTAPTALLLALGVTLALLGGALLQVVRDAARGQRSLRRLRTAASRCLAPGVHLVESDRAFSLTAGLGQSEIFLSTALAEALAPEHLAAVVAHEQAHVRSRDGLKTLAARVLSWPHFPAVRRAILAELELAMEQACDEHAGGRVGDRLVVAEAILAAERLLAATPTRSPLLAFGGSSVPDRVRGLLAEPVDDRRLPGGWVAGALLGAFLLLADPLHHTTEHVLGLLLGAH